MTTIIDNLVNEISRHPDHSVFGQVTAILGLLVEVGGVHGSLSVGDHCQVIGRKEKRVACEVVGFRDGRALLMPFGTLDGVGLGCRAELISSEPVIYPHRSWLGRVINAFGEPVDGKGPLLKGETSYAVRNQPPPAHVRQRVGGKVDPRSWPDGLDCEVFTADALAVAAAEARGPAEREHVTPFIRNRRDRFVVRNVACPVPGLADERWTLDTPQDLEFLGKVVDRLPSAAPPPFLEVVRLLDAEPTLRAINQEAPRHLYVFAEEDIASRGFERSRALLARAEKTIPIGSQTFSKSRVQYPEGQAPMFLTYGQGGRVWDVDGNEYVDLVSGLLPVVLGYRDADVDQAIRRQLDNGISFSLATTLEADLAERLVEIIPSAEMVRFGKNGSDATSAAVRLARAYTGRDRIAVCGYHGWRDWYIATTTKNKGVPAAVREFSHSFPYNDLEALDRLLDSHSGEFAAVTMEPMNTTEPEPEYMKGVRDIAHRHGALLVYDEIITGFRYALGGAQELFGVTPDLACFGKALGNGMPIAAVVGRADVMREMEEIFFSATFGGETLSLAAAIAVIDKMRREPVIETLWRTGERLAAGARASAQAHGLGDVVTFAGKPCWTFVQFKDHPAATSEAIKTLFIREMIRGGVLMLHSHNVCFAHGEEDVAHVLATYDRVFATVAEMLKQGDVEAQLDVPVIRPIFSVR